MYDLLDIIEDLISGDADRLDEELVAAPGVGRRLLLHRLKEDYKRRCVRQELRAVEADSG